MMKEEMKEAMREKIFAAADALNERGQKPTLILVRKEIGGGSYTTIQDALNQWRAGKITVAAPVCEPMPQSVSEKLNELGNSLWLTAVETANSRFASERETLESARLETETARREAAELADQLSGELEAAQARIATLEAEQTAIQTAANEAKNRAEIAEAQTNELRQQLARDREALDKAIETAMKATADAGELRGRLLETEKPKKQKTNAVA